MEHIQAGIAGEVLPVLSQEVRQTQSRRTTAREGPCVFGCETSAGRANGLQTWHDLPKSWMRAVETAAVDLIPDDSVLAMIDQGDILCSRHYRQVCRGIDDLLLRHRHTEPSDAPT